MLLQQCQKNGTIIIFVLADIIDDKLIHAQKILKKYNANKRFPYMQKENIYRGAEAYRKLLNNKDVDAVLKV